MALATTSWVIKWVMARATKVIVINAIAAVTIVLTSAVAAAIFIAAADTIIAQCHCPQRIYCAVTVAITHLFNTAIKWQWRGQ
jgi:hypothetical protein